MISRKSVKKAAQKEVARKAAKRKAVKRAAPKKRAAKKAVAANNSFTRRYLSGISYLASTDERQIAMALSIL